MGKMKLIVNADDYGLTVNVSKGILEGMRHGVITDTSAIVNTPYFAESAGMALENGIKEMGLHCLLTMGEPVLKAESVRSLVNDAGRFPTPEELKHRQVDMDEVEKELEAQIAVFLNSGLKLNHIDTHHGFMNKSREMTELFIKLAGKYDVPLRNESVHFGMDGRFGQYKAAGIKMADMLYLNHGTPHHTVQAVQEFLQEAIGKYECVEICCHAGYSDDILREFSVLNDAREEDLKVCLSKEIREYVRSQNIELISYSEIA